MENFLRTKGEVRKLVVAMSLILAMVMLLGGCAAAETTVKEQTSDFYVNDFAELFSDEQKETMMERAIDLDENYGGTQVVVTTITSLDGMTMEKYANTMYNQYGIGADSKGALIILSTEDREVRIEVGNGLEGYLTDSVSGRLIDDYALEYLKNDEFATGLVNLQEAVVNYIIENVPEDVLITTTTSEEVESSSTSEETVSDNADSDDEKMINFLIMLGFILIFSLIGGLFMRDIKNKTESEYEKTIKELEEKWNEELSSLKEEKEQMQQEKKKMKQEYEHKILLLKDQLDRSGRTITEKEQEYAKLTRENKAWHDLVVCLYPNIDEEVRLLEEKNNKDAAEKAFKQMKDITEGKLGRREDLHELQQANKIYENLTPDEKQYFPDAYWVKELKIKLNQAEIDYTDYQTAKEVENTVHSIIDNISSPDEDDVERLNQAMRYYTVLSSARKAYFSTELLERLKRMKKIADTDFEVQERIRRAEAERRRKEEEERRRREAERRRREEAEREERRRRESSSYHSSSSSSHHSSSFSGHGGHSSGGGAGRKF